MPCLKTTDPRANLRATFHWENYSIGSPQLCSFLVETMLVNGIHNFEYELIAKCTVMESRAFLRVTKTSISGEMVSLKNEHFEFV